MHRAPSPIALDDRGESIVEETNDNDLPPIVEENQQVGGVVTTLHKADLPILRSLLPLPLPSIPRAIIDIPYDIMADLSVLLPAGTSFGELLDHLNALTLLPQNTASGGFDHKIPLADVLEPFRDHLTLYEMDLFTHSPVSARDPNAINIFTNIVRDYAESGKVDVDIVFNTSRLLTTLDMVEATLATLPPLPPVLGIGRRPLTPPIIISSIPLLEVLHKSLILYIWLSYRLEVSFPDRELAMSYKYRTEVVLDDCLARLPGVRNKKTTERSREMDGIVAEWRRRHVNPNGTSKEIGTQGKKGIAWQPLSIAQRLKEKNKWRGVSFPIDEVEVGEQDLVAEDVEDDVPEEEYDGNFGLKQAAG